MQVQSSPFILLKILTSLWASSNFQNIDNVEHTFYGYPDNSPPGPAIAYDCGRGYIAGGDGSYGNPLTFASAPGEFSPCEIIYDLYTRKYLRFEDTCAQCTTDWNESGKWHIDIWTGSTTVDGGQTQIECEDALTPSEGQGIVRQPVPYEDVDATALFDSSGCHTSHVYPQQAKAGL